MQELIGDYYLKYLHGNKWSVLSLVDFQIKSLKRLTEVLRHASNFYQKFRPFVASFILAQSPRTRCTTLFHHLSSSTQPFRVCFISSTIHNSIRSRFFCRSYEFAGFCWLCWSWQQIAIVLQATCAVCDEIMVKLHDYEPINVAVKQVSESYGQPWAAS